MNSVIKSIETDFARINLLKGNIGHVHFKANVLINEEIQNELLNHYQKITEESIPFIYSSEEFLDASKGAPEHAKQIEAKSPISMKVLIVNNLAQRIMARYYYKIHKPLNPFKICSSFDDAITWVNQNRVFEKKSA